MRWISVSLVIGLGIISAAPGKTATAENALPAPAGSQPAALNTSTQPAAPRSSAAWDSTAITETTEVGRKIAAPTADRPAYVVIFSKGQHDFGSLPAAEKAATPDILDQQLGKALAQLHYLRADDKHQPTYLIVFSWGVHSAANGNNDDAGYRNLLDRAALVGGSGFANELAKVIEQNQSVAYATSTGAFGAQLPGMRPTSAASLFVSVSPIEVFRRRDQKTEDLLMQAANDCYYMVISAIGYSTAGQGKSQLLWRTKLTTTTPGISMADAIPSLIASGGGYLGRNMNEAEFFSRR